MQRFTYLPLLLLLCLGTSVRAQKPPGEDKAFDRPPVAERVFPISAKLAHEVLTSAVSAEQLADVVVPLPVGTEEAKLPHGHYLRGKLIGHQVKFTYFANYPYNLTAAANGGTLELRLFDGQQRAIADAKIHADGHPVRYRERHKAYRRRDWRVDLVDVVVGTDTVFYRVEEDIDRSRIGHLSRRVLQTLPGRIITLPVGVTLRTIRYFKRGFDYGDWAWYRYPFKRYIRPVFRPGDAVGYVTTSQPKYRPDDTLRVSAYLTRPNGRPLRADSLRVTIDPGYRYGKNALYCKMIARGAPGHYALELPIKATWSLDKTYRVRFDNPRWSWRGVDPSISFKLEDYELTEYKLSATKSYDARIPGAAWLDVITEDINGLALPDAELSVLVYLDQIDKFLPQAGSITLPDTLYAHREPTENRRQRRIVLPDSIFPAGYSLRVRVLLQLTGPSGEYKTVTKYLVVDRRYPAVPTLEAVGDSLYAYLATGKQSFRDSAWLITVGAVGKHERTVALPLQMPLDHQQQKYVLRYGDQEEELKLADLRPSTGTPLRITRDTLRLYYPNKHGNPLYWQLIGPDRTYDQDDVTAGDTLLLTGLKEGGFFRFRTRYLAGGSWRNDERTFTVPRFGLLTTDPNLLKVSLEQPERVRPGETVRVAVRAVDQRGRPAANVRLSAGTYNARFKDTPVKMPTYTQRWKRSWPKQDYAQKPVIFTGKAALKRRMVEQLKLDTVKVFALRYPKPEFELRRPIDTLITRPKVTAHFVPFVTDGAGFRAVRTVYANDRLVYWYHPNITTPYSIPVDTGWQEIVLRTDSASYTKKIHFRAGEQYVTSFLRARAQDAGWERQAKREWTLAEVDDLYRHVFAAVRMNGRQGLRFRRGHKGMLQSGRAGSYARWLPLGIANEGEYLRFFTDSADTLTFRFENKALYNVREDRDRLYPFDKDLLWGSLNRPAGAGPSRPGLPNYVAPGKRVNRSPVHYGAANQRPAFSRLSSQPKTYQQDNRARVQFVGRPRGMKNLIITPVTGNTYYRLTNERSRNYAEIRPGTYELLLHTSSDSIFTQTLVLHKDSLYFLRYDQRDFRFKDTFDVRLDFHVPKFSQRRMGRKVSKVDQLTPTGETISGRVTDEGGDPLIGVAVWLKGTETGTVTDIDGYYSLPVYAEVDALVFSYTGYETQHLLVAELLEDNQSVSLSPSTTMLDEVVVIGYGSQKKQDVTASISRVTVNGLVGRVAAVQERAVDLTAARTETTQRADLPAANLRETFADYAGFVPYLRTDRKGYAAFDVTFPDDITAWNTFAVGQDRKRRVGFTIKQARSFLPLQAQLYLPRFLVEGDRSEARTLAINRTENDLPVRLSFSGSNVNASTKDTLITNSISSNYPIQAGGTTDSLKYQFSLRQTGQGSGESDGEVREIKVYPKGTEMVAGELFMLSDTTEPLPAAFVRPERGEVTLRLVGNRVGQLLGDLDYISDYPYGCGEQLASRLIGLLAKRRIRMAEGKPFDQDKAVRKLVAGLTKLRRPDGGYGWWETSKMSATWITRHVYRALADADRDYAVGDLTPVRRYLLTRAAEMNDTERLQTYLTLAEEGHPPSVREMETLDTIKVDSDFRFLALLRLHQLRGDTINADRVMARAQAHAVYGRYWGSRGAYWYRMPLRNRLNATLLAHRILRTAGRSADADLAVNYLLGQTAAPNRPGNVPLLGTNTLESARLVDELLPVLLTGAGDVRAASVIIDGIAEGRQEITRFPYERKLTAEAAARIRLRRAGSGSMPGTIYQRYFEDDPVATDKGYAVETRFVNAAGRELSDLRKGETAYLEVSVTAKADGDYVMIEVPIPAGCSYADRNERKGPLAVHRAYERDRVAIFCDRLPAGRWVYRVALAPRFAGVYTVNPGRVGLQYLPGVFGVGAVKQVRIR